MAKTRRPRSPRTGSQDDSPKKRTALSTRLQRFIRIFRPARPSTEVIIPDTEDETTNPDVGDTTTENTGSTSNTSTNTGGTGSTDPTTDPNAPATPDIMEPMIGEIKMFAGNFAPRGWAFCDGQLLPINDYAALFSIMGTTYGGDGRTTFGLPDLRGRVPLHPGQGDGLENYQAGQKGGAESVVLGEAQMPNHNHGVNHITAQANSADPGDKMLAPGEAQIYGSGTQTTEMNSGMIDKSGGGQAHNNMQPFLGVNFIIALEGIYPSRS